MTSPETLRSILCAETWDWNDGTSSITFHENGTGKLFCTTEVNLWIEAEIDWKPHNPDCLDQVVTLDNKSWKSKLVSEFSIEITLTTRLPHEITNRKIFNEGWLNDEAFRPKTYNIRLEQGRFRNQFDIMHNVRDGSQYALRLVFDPSPFPLDEEWNDRSNGPHVMKFWEWTEFNARRYEEKELGLWDKLMVWYEG
ncbi:hypothetical protein BO94DRAFT_544062 [Aspergillus sclerotioniger CBS 115572]|uniref:Uncharacterized protein n=1 Tax=Aspergillus sclerotioniger CBS 115572 TaxID=1450535 RepID=A0A317X494_9EURO|nr:hypothetical protein BO94DRAFT_544062 [Aspergillus sclerotioniger CBS 115572]PWY93011.1 hypothetical protein BO94DRAFT_544062 [Aspergillus sclerotioniger CBS 115572]